MLHDHKWPETQEQLTHQLSRLAREAEAMSRTVQRMSAETGRQAGNTAAEVVGEALHQGEMLARGAGKQARQVGMAIRKDPLPAVVAVAGLLLLLNLALGRKR